MGGHSFGLKDDVLTKGRLPGFEAADLEEYLSSLKHVTDKQRQFLGRRNVVAEGWQARRLCARRPKLPRLFQRPVRYRYADRPYGRVVFEAKVA